MRRYIIAGLVILALVSKPFLAQEKPLMTNEQVKTLESFIEEKVQAGGIVGLSAALIVDKKLVWSKGFGYADKAEKKPFTTHTIMNIGSISKTFTGASLMHAVQQGLVSLDVDINRYLPFEVNHPFFSDEKITLRNLASHTSGIVDRYEVYDKAYHNGRDSPEPLGEFLKSYFNPQGKHYSKDNFLEKRPGTYRDYSNIGAALAGYIVELATGERLNEYSKKHLFTPLQMDDTGWFLADVDLDQHTKLYEKADGQVKPIPWYGLTTYPDGGVRTSVSSLSKFFIALLNGGAYNGARILEEEMAEEMLRFQYTAHNKPENIDLVTPNKNCGIFWETKRNVTRMGHSGSDPGIRTDMLTDLNREIGVILFMNTTLGGGEYSKYYFPIFDELWKYGEKLKNKD